MKVIFLDIDGVLNVSYIGDDEFGQIFNDIFVKNLEKLLIETNAKLVISSTWRDSGLNFLHDMWKERKLPGEIIDITPNFMVKTGSVLQRGSEIAEWLSKNEVDNYVIIDDEVGDMLEEQINNIVRCSRNHEHIDQIYGMGLTTECTIQAIKILNYETR